MAGTTDSVSAGRGSGPSASVTPVTGRVTPRWLVAGAVVAAVVLRAWILASPLGRADADETVVGLMARAFLDGEPSVFFWGQSYGGVAEPALVAVAFAVAGTSALALKLVPALLSGVAAFLVWRVGRRTVGDRAAPAAALLFLLYPPFLWWSTKERGFYWAALVLGLAVLLSALRIRDAIGAPRVLDLVALGFFSGLAWWTTPQSMYLVVPVLAWLAVRRARLWAKAWPVVPAAVAGALPWIAWNLRHGLSSLEEPTPWVASTYPERTGRFFTTLLPTLLGVRHSFTHDWLLGPLGLAVTVAALVAFAAFVVRVVRIPERWRPVEPLVVVAVAFPFLFAIPKASHYVVEPRYGLMLSPVIALLVAVPLVTRTRQVVAVVVAAGLGVVTIAALQDFSDDNRMVVDLRPPRLGALAATLDSAGVDRVYADYWIAYPLTFETRERIVATPVDAVRSAKYDEMVDDARSAAYVVFGDSPRDLALAPALRELGVGFERIETGVFAVYLLERHVPPDDLRSVWGG